MIPILDNRQVITIRDKQGRERRVALPLKWGDSSRPDYQSFSSLTPAQREHVVKSVISFPYFFHAVFLPSFSRGAHKDYPSVLFPHVDDLCQRYQRAAHPLLLPFDVFDDEYTGVWRVATVSPNRSLKTAVTTDAFPLWLIGNYPESMRVMILTSAQSLGERHTELHRAYITGNKDYINVFGLLHREPSSKKWTEGTYSVDAMENPTDPSAAVFGIDGSIEGQGCDVGIADDCQQMSNSITVEARAKHWQTLNQALLGRLDSRAAMLLVIQTRHADDDFAGRIQQEARDTGSWDYKEIPAFLEPDRWPPKVGDFVDPTLPPEKLWRVENLNDPDFWRARLMCDEVLPLEKLLSDWQPESARVAFARTRLNRVMDPELKWFPRVMLQDLCRADGGFKHNSEVRPLLRCWVVEKGIPQEGDDLWLEYHSQGINITRRVVSIDTAATDARPGADPDFTVIQLWGMDESSFLRVLLDQMRFRTSSPEVFQSHLKRFVNAYQPHYVIMETNGMARWIGVTAEKTIGYPITKFQRGKDAVAQVEQFKSLAESGLLLYCWGDGRSIERMKPFEDELDAYRGGSHGGAHDDTLVAAVQAYTLLRPTSRETTAVTASSVRTQEMMRKAKDGKTRSANSILDLREAVAVADRELRELSRHVPAF
jgi:phage terminase large subunit-like protein